jgi:hypothetical protein
MEYELPILERVAAELKRCGESSVVRDSWAELVRASKVRWDVAHPAMINWQKQVLSKTQSSANVAWTKTYAAPKQDALIIPADVPPTEAPPPRYHVMTTDYYGRGELDNQWAEARRVVTHRFTSWPRCEKHNRDFDFSTDLQGLESARKIVFHLQCNACRATPHPSVLSF